MPLPQIPKPNAETLQHIIDDMRMDALELGVEPIEVARETDSDRKLAAWRQLAVRFWYLVVVPQLDSLMTKMQNRAHRFGADIEPDIDDPHIQARLAALAKQAPDANEEGSS